VWWRLLAQADATALNNLLAAAFCPQLSFAPSCMNNVHWLPQRGKMAAEVSWLPQHKTRNMNS
jgi:hypothetical protein